jgi:hypothetical protein
MASERPLMQPLRTSNSLVSLDVTVQLFTSTSPFIPFGFNLSPTYSPSVLSESVALNELEILRQKQLT